jgi:hypothetical protein
MAPRFVDTLGLDFLLLLERDGRQDPASGLLACRIVAHFDVVEHVPARFIAALNNRIMVLHVPGQEAVHRVEHLQSASLAT